MTTNVTLPFAQSVILQNKCSKYFHLKIYLEMQPAIWFLLKAVDISLQPSHECS